MFQTGPCRFCRKVISIKPGSFRNHSRLINFLEDIFEPTIILLQNGVLGRHELNHLISRYSISLLNLALTNGIFLVKAILNEEWAKPVMDLQTEYQFHCTWNQGPQERTSSVLYIASAIPLPLKSYTLRTVGSDPSCGVYTICSLPGPGATKSVERYYMRRKVSIRSSKDLGLAVKAGHTDQDKKYITSAVWA